MIANEHASAFVGRLPVRSEPLAIVNPSWPPLRPGEDTEERHENAHKEHGHVQYDFLADGSELVRADPQCDYCCKYRGDNQDEEATTESGDKEKAREWSCPRVEFVKVVEDPGLILLDVTFRIWPQPLIAPDSVQGES